MRTLLSHSFKYSTFPLSANLNSQEDHAGMAAIAEIVFFSFVAE